MGKSEPYKMLPFQAASHSRLKLQEAHLATELPRETSTSSLCEGILDLLRFKSPLEPFAPTLNDTRVSFPSTLDNSTHDAVGERVAREDLKLSEDLKVLLDALAQEFAVEYRAAVADPFVQHQARSVMREAHRPLHRSLIPYLIEAASADLEFSALSQKERDGLVQRFLEHGEDSHTVAVSFDACNASHAQDFWDRLRELHRFIETDVAFSAKLEAFACLEACHVLYQRNPNLSLVLERCAGLGEALLGPMVVQCGAEVDLAGLLSLEVLFASRAVTQRYDERLVHIYRRSVEAQVERLFVNSNRECLEISRDGRRQKQLPTWQRLEQEVDSSDASGAREAWERLSRNPYLVAVTSLYGSHYERVREMFFAYCSVAPHFESSPLKGKARACVETVDQSFIGQMVAPLIDKLPQPLAQKVARKGLVPPTHISLLHEPLFWALDRSFALRLDLTDAREARTIMLHAIVEQFGEVPYRYSKCIYDRIYGSYFELLGEIDWMVDLLPSAQEFWRNVTGRPKREDIFHEGLNHAVRAGRAETSYGIETIAFGHFLLLLAAFPEYAVEATDLVSAIHARISLRVECERPTKEMLALRGYSAAHQSARQVEKELHNTVLGTVVALYLVADATRQGRSLAEAKFCSAFESRWLSVHELLDNLKEHSGPHRIDTLERWAFNIFTPMAFWDSMYVGLHKIGYQEPACYQYIRAFIEPAVFKGKGDPWPTGSAPLKFSFEDWPCFSPASKHRPAADEIAIAICALLFYKDSRSVELFERFSKLMKSLNDPDWTKHISLSYAVVLYVTFLELYQDEPSHRREASHNDHIFRQMLIGLGSFGSEGDDIRRIEELDSSREPREWLLSHEAEVAQHLVSAPLSFTPHDSLDVLFAASVLGVDSSTTAQEELSVSRIFKAFEAGLLGNKIAPLRSGWVSRNISIVRTRAVSENLAMDLAKEVIDRRLQELELYGIITQPYTQSLSDKLKKFTCSPQYAFYAALESRPRYRRKLHSIAIGKPTRSTLLQFVEAVVEGCSGGKYDDIACVKDPAFVAELKDRLELASLVGAVRGEYEQHEEPQRLKNSSLCIAFRPTRGVLTEFVGHICDTCFTRAHDISLNAPFMTFVPFIKNPEATGKNGVYPRFAGGSLVIEARAVTESGEPENVLLIRGFNPNAGLLKLVRAHDIFEEFADYLQGVAQAQGARYVVIPRESSWGLAFTNRPYSYFHVEGRYFNDPKATRMRILDPEAVMVNSIPVEDVVVVRTV